MSKSWKHSSERDKKPPERQLTPEEEYEQGKRRKPRNVNDWASDDELPDEEEE